MKKLFLIGLISMAVSNVYGITWVNNSTAEPKLVELRYGVPDIQKFALALNFGGSLTTLAEWIQARMDEVVEKTRQEMSKARIFDPLLNLQANADDFFKQLKFKVDKIAGDKLIFTETRIVMPGQTVDFAPLDIFGVTHRVEMTVKDGVGNILYKRFWNDKVNWGTRGGNFTIKMLPNNETKIACESFCLAGLMPKQEWPLTPEQV